MYIKYLVHKMAKKRPLILIIKGLFLNLKNIYFTFTVTDLLFCDQANGVDPVLTGLSFP